MKPEKANEGFHEKKIQTRNTLEQNSKDSMGYSLPESWEGTLQLQGTSLASQS